MITERTTCRACDCADLDLVVDLGEIYPSNFISEGGSPVGPFPMALVQCKGCDLVQMKHTLDLDVSYRQYWYASALNASMVDALEDIADDVHERIHLRRGDVLVDIGCNDGTLLSMFHKRLTRVGVDPALNLGDRAREHCDVFINDYFTGSALDKENLGKAKVITSIAMFYDLEDPNAFIDSVRKNLADDGLWVIQMMDLKCMMETKAFDNICFEHLEYYSLAVLIPLLAKHGLLVEDVSYNTVNGGSLRAIVRHVGQGFYPTEAVGIALTEEKAALEKFPVADLGRVVKEVIRDVRALIKEVSEDGPVYVLGASTKGNTLLQVCGLDYRDLPKALEVNSDKFGMKTVATNIPIVKESEGMKDEPAGLLILPWCFTSFFKGVFAEYMEDGGKLIAPLPEPRIIQKEII